MWWHKVMTRIGDIKWSYKVITQSDEKLMTKRDDTKWWQEVITHVISWSLNEKYLITQSDDT